MAAGKGRIIGGLGAPHAPSIGVALDRGKAQSPEWKPLFDGFEPMKAWLKEKKPDVAILIYNDHGTTFFFDQYPTFALGVGELHEIADEGWGKRPLADIPGHPDLAWQLAHSLVDLEFDIAVCQEMPLDHGAQTPMSVLWDAHQNWPVPIIPICVNVLQPPIPSARRCFKLGQAIRKVVEAYEEDIRVAVIGTAGLSHQLHGERFGFNNPEWDAEFMELLEKDPERIASMTHQELMARGGCDSVEMIMWMVMRGALAPQVKCLHKNYYLPMLTGFGQIILEDAADARAPEEA